MTRSYSFGRLIRSHGRDVTHHYYTRTEADGREHWDEAADSPDTISLIPDTATGARSMERDERAVEPNLKRSFYGRDDIGNLSDGGGGGASILTMQGTDYIVLQINDLDGGFVEIITERDD